ncbi:MAG: PQQ-binding-like beta-propeller repeat protein [Bryobacterales bacterium]|nr:PQQ-binding-like beta-propeller repeat protein [Bryobacterales bacterium]
MIPTLAAASAVALAFAVWPQFRGPNAAGVSEAKNLPVDVGVEKHVIWKTTLPPGYSSPSISADRIYITGIENDKLWTFALERATGRIVWRREAPRPRVQEMQRANSAVTATPATDGRNVYVFFQDFGLLAYGPDGNELWKLPLGPFNNPFGHGSSPILTGNTLLMNIDQDTGSYLLALDKNTGKTLWRAERPLAQRGYATPVLYEGNQVIVTGSYRMSSYDLRTGRELWYIRRLPWQIKPTPVIADGVVYFTTYAGESDPGQQEIVPPFAEALAKLDTNKDGKIAKSEIADKKAEARFDEYLDLDDTGFLEERDWEQFRERRLGENALRAYRIKDAKGDITESGFLWKASKTLPNVPSPLIYQGVLYMVKEGGIFTSFDPATGAVLKQARLTGALGDYYASPVGADGKIYVGSRDGNFVVLRAGGRDWDVMHVADLGAPINATAAPVDSRLYVRTDAVLFCFGKQGE